MTFKELLDLTKNRVNELDSDSQVDSILKNAINEAYSEISKKDKRLSKAFIPIINGMATLPEEIFEIESISPELLSSDRKIGNAILTSLTGILEITYSALREALVNDDDVPDLSTKYQYILTSYAAYAYYLYRKKLDVAMQFLNEYQFVLTSMDSSDNVKYYVQDVYGQALREEF